MTSTSPRWLQVHAKKDAFSFQLRKREQAFEVLSITSILAPGRPVFDCSPSMWKPHVTTTRTTACDPLFSGLTSLRTALIFNLVRCSDEPHACILHQMLAPSHSAHAGVILKPTFFGRIGDFLEAVPM